MIKLTLHDDDQIYINANQVVYVQKDAEHTTIKLSTGYLIHVKEKVNRVVDALTVHLKPRG